MNEYLKDAALCASVGVVDHYLQNTYQHLAAGPHAQSCLWDYEHGPVRDIAFSAYEVLETGISLFTGHRPVCPVYADEFDALPWATAYWQEERIGDSICGTLRQKSPLILAEISSIAYQLIELNGLDDVLRTPGAVWFCPALLSLKETAVKGMAVQAIVCADVALSDIKSGDLASAGSLLSTAQRSLSLAHLDSLAAIEIAKAPDRTDAFAGTDQFHLVQLPGSKT